MMMPRRLLLPLLDLMRWRCRYADIFSLAAAARFRLRFASMLMLSLFRCLMLPPPLYAL